MNFQILVFLSVVYIAHSETCNFIKNADTGRYLTRNGPRLVSTGISGEIWCFDETVVNNKQCTTVYLKTANLFLDSNTSGKVYVLEPNGGAYQTWNITKSNQLINCQTGRALDSNVQGHAYGNPVDGTKSQKWWFQAA